MKKYEKYSIIKVVFYNKKKGEVVFHQSKNMSEKQNDRVEELLELMEEMIDDERFAAILQKVIYKANAARKVAKAQRALIDVEERLSALFTRFGIPAYQKGYCFLRTALVRVIEERQSIKQGDVTKLYEEVADEYGVSMSSVEKAMRHSIETAFERGNLEELDKVFGNIIDCSKGKTTNSEFIATVSEYIKLGMDLP